MSVYLDRTYLLRVSPKLSKFTQKKSDLYNFRCPFCGDSQKNKNKARGYIYRKANDYFYKCQNCQIGHSMYNFLDKVDPSLVKEYALERYKDGTVNGNYVKPTFEEAKAKPVFKKSLGIPSIESLPEQHYAKDYVKTRKIPEHLYKTLYFAEDFKQFVESLQIEKNGLQDNDPRLVIPFYDKDKNLVAFQGRALGQSKLRYITVKVSEEQNKIYGLDRIDQDKNVCVTEGPIDSMFLDNAVATADSNLESATKVLGKDKITLVFDNEPRNKEICKMIEHAIDNHFHVVIWPEYVEAKDINDMVLDGFSPDEIQDIIDSNTFVNLRAKMEFIKWKKV